MSNPSKQKGTGGETELRKLMGVEGLHRTPPASIIDLQKLGPAPLSVLATRPDKGRWLMTVTLDDFMRLYRGEVPLDTGLNIEVKRYKRFALHVIWESKFGRGSRG